MSLFLFNPSIGPYQVLLRRARVDLGAMAMKECSVFSKTPPFLEPHHQIVQCHIQDTHWVFFTPPPQRCSQCILQAKLTWQPIFEYFLFYWLEFIFSSIYLSEFSLLSIWIYFLSIWVYFFLLSILMYFSSLYFSVFISSVNFRVFCFLSLS